MANYLELKKFDDFERKYISVRQAEDRIHSLETIKELPFLKDKNNPNYKEWKFRAHTYSQFKRYFDSENINSFLDLGCGNGWFINQLYSSNIKFTGIEVNRTELLQANQLFENYNNIDLFLGDIFEMDFENKFDMITISGAVQYFSSINNLLEKLICLLKPNGSIHILDSPFYRSTKDCEKARMNSKKYYHSLNNKNEMANYYFHHLISELDQFNPGIKYDPQRLDRKALRKLGFYLSPFPWIQIIK